MKLKSLIIALIMMMGVFAVNAGNNAETSEAEAALAPCSITISNSIDCFVPVNIYIDCGSGPMLVMSGQLNPGSWSSPTPNAFPLPAAYCPLPPNCRVLPRVPEQRGICTTRGRVLLHYSKSFTKQLREL